MRPAILASAFAGCATIACAHDFSLTIVPELATASFTGSYTLSVYGDASIGTHLLGGAFGLEISSGAELITDMTWTPAEWSVFNTDGGYAGNGVYNQVIFGQLVIPPAFPPGPASEIGSLIGYFTVDHKFLGEYRTIEFNLVPGDPFTLETVDAVTGETFRSIDGDLTLGQARVTVIPAPGTLALLGAGGLCLGRRRRSAS